MKRDRILISMIFVMATIICFLGSSLWFITHKEKKQEVKISYYSWRGEYLGSSIFDSVLRYPDSTVYYWDSTSFSEPVEVYFNRPGKEGE